MTRTDDTSHSVVLVSKACPPWCSAEHGELGGEEDWIHESSPKELSEGVHARLRMSVDPSTGIADGPYLFVGSREYTLEAADALARSLMAMVAQGDAR